MEKYRLRKAKINDSESIAKLVVNLGGVSGSLGSKNSLNSFVFDETLISPLICYESIYGDMNLGETSIWLN